MKTPTYFNGLGGRLGREGNTGLLVGNAIVASKQLGMVKLKASAA